jgi:TPR repeat protein
MPVGEARSDHRARRLARPAAADVRQAGERTPAAAPARAGGDGDGGDGTREPGESDKQATHGARVSRLALPAATLSQSAVNRRFAREVLAIARRAALTATARRDALCASLMPCLADIARVLAAPSLFALATGCGAAASNAPPPPPAVTVAPAAAAAPAASSTADASGNDIVGLYTRACNGGSDVGCNNLGLVYLYGRHRTKKDPAKAVGLFQRGCELGSAVACGNLGYMLLDGTGAPPDEGRGLDLLGRACDGSSWEFCVVLGNYYFDGAHEDAPRATSFYDRACRGGFQAACADLAAALQIGKGAAKNTKRAAELYEPACKAGVAIACTGLANLAMVGEGVAKNPDRARLLYLKGCTDDSPAGCYVLGVICAGGKLGDEAPCAAHGQDLLKRACDAGYPKACTELAAWLQKQEASAP